MPIALPTDSSPLADPPLASDAPGRHQTLDLEALFREHHERVFRAAYRVTGNASDAEDVLQTVFMRLLRREDELDLSASAASYLHRAAVNAALDLLRRRRRRGDVDLEGVESTLEDRQEAGPERHRHGRELAADLRHALARIAPRHAEIFSLRYLEGHGNKEIAAMLGSTQTTIAVTLHRVRARLQKDLAAHRGELS
ncbi:MAG TPA: RNA polymerase sigma factor [Thermoanaerobaculia bacterium]|nr:RNA polymerase sigma factor [Thermoanaerobaculia bacterium]